jgi:hypothetical protein
VVDVTDPVVDVTVVVEVVTDPGRVVVVTVVVGETVVVVVVVDPGTGPAPGCLVGAAEAGAGAGAATVPRPADVMASRVPTIGTTGPRTRLGRALVAPYLPTSCPRCIGAPPSTPGGAGRRGRARLRACSGSPADSGSPVALRPHLAVGLPCSPADAAAVTPRCLRPIVLARAKLHNE